MVDCTGFCNDTITFDTHRDDEFGMVTSMVISMVNVMVNVIVINLIPCGEVVEVRPQHRAECHRLCCGLCSRMGELVVNHMGDCQ